MIQKADVFTVDSSALAAVQFSLNDANLAHVFGILRNNLYSNKILAVIREYSTNAHDANVENGIIDPIQVTLPTVFEPVFKVRDFGKGLSEKEIFEIYSSYGASTKRESNEYIGTLGMGSKSGFAYASSFTVTSYNGGRKCVYEAFIDESQIGTIAKVIDEPSSENTGIEITIGVESSDVKKFNDEALKFYTWFNPIPKFYGNDITNSINTFWEKVLSKSDDGITFINVGYYTTNVTRGLYVRMGNTCYPVADSQKYAPWLTADVILVCDVQIGDVQFTASRESLEYTKYTEDTLHKASEKARKFITASTQLKIDKCASAWDVIKLYATLSHLERGALANHLVYKGNVLATDINALLRQCSVQVARLDAHSWKSKDQWKWRSSQVYDLRNAAFIVQDGGYKAYTMSDRRDAAYQHLLQQGYDKSSIYFLRGAIADINKFIALPELHGAPHAKLSSFGSNLPVQRRAKKVHSDNAKRLAWNGSNRFPYSTCWSEVTPLKKGKCVYVQISKFLPEGGSNFTKLKAARNVFGQDFVVYGIRKDEDIPAGWISLDDYMCAEWEKFLKTKEWRDTQCRKAWDSEKHLVLSCVGKCLGDLMFKYHENILCPVSQKLLQIMKSAPVSFSDDKRFVLGSYCVKDSGQYQKQIEYATVSIRASIADAIRIVNQLNAMYPLLAKYELSNYGYRASDHHEAAIEYINALWTLKNPTA